MRDKAIADAEGQHARTPGIVADLFLGLRYFLDFARAVGAITQAEREDLARRGWQGAHRRGRGAVQHGEAAEPCGHFVRLLASVIASGRGHLAGPNGEAPDAAERWGWRCSTAGTGEHARDEWRPQGHRVGWVDGEAVFLEPEAAYAAAHALAHEQGTSLAVSARTLWKRLDERGLLAERDEARQRLTVRRRLGGQERREVLFLAAAALSPPARPSQPSPPSPNGEKPRQMQACAGDGRGDGCDGSGPDRPRDRPQETPGNHGNNGAGDGRDGQIQGVEAPPGELFPPPASASDYLRHERGQLP